MKRKAQAKIDFILLDPSDKIAKAQIFHDKIFAAAGTFVTPDMTMVQYQIDIAAFATLVKAVDEGDHSKIEARNQAEETLNDDMRLLAKYVSRIANGDETIIVLGGFTPTKTDIPAPQAPAQAVITGGPGKVIGSLKLEAEKLEFAVRYTFIVGEDVSGVTVVNGNVVVTNTPKPVVIRTTKGTKTSISELETRVNYQCMCFATSTAGAGKVSEIIIVKTT